MEVSNKSFNVDGQRMVAVLLMVLAGAVFVTGYLLDMSGSAWELLMGMGYFLLVPRLLVLACTPRPTRRKRGRFMIGSANTLGVVCLLVGVAMQMGWL